MTGQKMSHSMEPRHGGERKGNFTWRVDARDYADGAVPVHVKTKKFLSRWRAAEAMREEMWRRPDVEMRIMMVPPEDGEGERYVILNEFYETLGQRREWYPVGRKVARAEPEPTPEPEPAKKRRGRPPGSGGPAPKGKANPRARPDAAKPQDRTESTAPEPTATRPPAPVPETKWDKPQSLRSMTGPLSHARAAAPEPTPEPTAAPEPKPTPDAKPMPPLNL